MSNFLQQSDNFITLYKSSSHIFKKLLEKEFERCREESLRPRIFIDIRGLFINIHDKNGKEICKNFLKKDIPAYSREIITIVNNWCKIVQQEGFLPVIIPFGEVGSSHYHKKLEENYKVHREKAAMLNCGEELIEASKIYIRKEILNVDWIFSTRGTNVCSIISEDLEFDAAVHLITKNVPEHLTVHEDGNVSKEKYFNIILSKDKDFAQLLNKNTIQIIKKARGDYELITEENASEILLKMKHKIEPKWLNLALAMIGDASDGYSGLKGCGEVLAGEFLFNHKEELEKIPSKNNYKKFKSYMKREDISEKSFLKVKKIYMSNKKAFFRSYLLADFDSLIEIPTHRKLLRTHIEKYKRIVFSDKNISIDKVEEKRRYIESKFKNRYKMVSEMSYYNILVNTIK